MAIKISGTTVIDDSRNIDNAGTVCATTIYGDGSNLTNIPVLNEVFTPINSSPADGATNIGDGPTLSASAYYSLYGVSMCCSQWQVDDNSDFSSPVFNLCCSGTGTSVTLSSGTLCTSCTYYWRVRYFDNCGCCSDYSNSTCFTTCATFAPTTLGESFAGGFYTGTICAAGTCYYLIVAPNATGCVRCQWKITQTLTGVCNEADTNVNGYNNTYTYLANSTHPAGNWTATRTIGGFSDWYLPAKDELNQMYINKGSMPSGEGYDLEYYFPSTEAYSTHVCRQAMFDGVQGSTFKTLSCPSRAIRRVPF